MTPLAVGEDLQKSMIALASLIRVFHRFAVQQLGLHSAPEWFDDHAVVAVADRSH
jgi:hypothetical protein